MNLTDLTDLTDMPAQSRFMSLIESMANVAVGYAVAVATQLVIFPLFGISVSVTANMAIGGVFTVVSIVRSYALRRLFETIRTRSTQRSALLRNHS